jgi:hypothetical protein
MRTCNALATQSGNGIPARIETDPIETRIPRNRVPAHLRLAERERVVGFQRWRLGLAYGGLGGMTVGRIGNPSHGNTAFSGRLSAGRARLLEVFGRCRSEPA